MPEKLSAAVAAVVNRLCAERGISGNALHKLTGIPQTSLAAKLAGRSRFDLDDLPLLAAALEVKPSDLVDWAQE